MKLAVYGPVHLQRPYYGGTSISMGLLGLILPRTLNFIKKLLSEILLIQKTLVRYDGILLELLKSLSKLKMTVIWTVYVSTNSLSEKLT